MELKPKEDLSLQCDSVPLMHQLARMANIEQGRIRKMVLVLVPDDPPFLYVESFLLEEKMEKLTPTELVVSAKPVTVNLEGGIQVNAGTGD